MKKKKKNHCWDLLVQTIYCVSILNDWKPRFSWYINFSSHFLVESINTKTLARKSTQIKFAGQKKASNTYVKNCQQKTGKKKKKIYYIDLCLQMICCASLLAVGTHWFRCYVDFSNHFLAKSINQELVMERSLLNFAVNLYCQQKQTRNCRGAAAVPT